jgi:ribosomal protein L40E
MKSGLNGASCLLCHSGLLDETKVALKLGSPDELLPEKLSKEMKIEAISKDYMPAKFPHLKIIENLTDISNKNKLARHFHSDQTTICLGCHHKSPVEAKKPLPLCRTCHSNRMMPYGTGTPGLLGVYHRRCLGCHKEMKREPTKCTGCHAEKVAVQAGMDEQSGYPEANKK